MTLCFNTDPHTCHDIKIQLPNSPSGVFEIDPFGPLTSVTNPPNFEVYCDLSTDVGKAANEYC